MKTTNTVPGKGMAARGAPDSQRMQIIDPRSHLGYVERQAQVLFYTDDTEIENIGHDRTDWGDIESDGLDFKHEPDVYGISHLGTNSQPRNDYLVEPKMEYNLDGLSISFENIRVFNPSSIGCNQQGNRVECFRYYPDLSIPSNYTSTKLPAEKLMGLFENKLSNKLPENMEEEVVLDEAKEDGKKVKKKIRVRRENQEEFDAKFYKGSYRLTSSFTLFPTIEEIAHTELGSIILNGDVEGYYDYMTKYLKPKRNGNREQDCENDCICKDAFLLSRKNDYHLTPLHLAVSTKNKVNENFLFSIIDNATIKSEFSARIRNKEQRELISTHYHCLTTNWLVDRRLNMRTSAFELAAELGYIEHIKTIMNSRKGQYALELVKATNYKRYNYEECFVHQHLKDQSVLSGLLESETFDELDGKTQAKIIKELRITQVDHAICAALEKGKLDLVRYIVEEHNNFDNSGLIYLSENWVPQTPFVKNGPYPPSHILAYNSLYKEFKSLPEKFRMALDLHGHSVLPWLLGFDDDQVLEQMKLFRGMGREDLFSFVKEIIVKNRRYLLGPALKMALANRNNFIPNPQENHLSYGLHGRVTLPLEMAILRAGDMASVDIITKAYAKQDKFSEEMCSEDCLRCLKGIQDIATKMTDQSRLALILILLPFVDVFSKRFKKIICTYNKKSELSSVGSFVDSEYATMRNRSYKPRLTHVSCVQAMEDARAAVRQWNGDLELNSTVPKLDSRIKKIKREPRDRSQLMLITEKTTERQPRRRKTEKKKEEEKIIASDLAEMKEDVAEVWKNYV